MVLLQQQWLASGGLSKSKNRHKRQHPAGRDTRRTESVANRSSPFESFFTQSCHTIHTNGINSVITDKIPALNNRTIRHNFQMARNLQHLTAHRRDGFRLCSASPGAPELFHSDTRLTQASWTPILSSWNASVEALLIGYGNQSLA